MLHCGCTLYELTRYFTEDRLRLNQFLELLLLSAVWGSSFLFIKLAVPEFGAFALVFVRTVAAGLILLPMVYLRGNLEELKHHWRHIFILSLMASSVPFSLFAYTAAYVTSGFASILNATIPIWIVVLGLLLFGEKVSKISLIGLLLGFAGVWVLYGDDAVPQSSSITLPVAAALLATLMYALTGFYHKRFLVEVDPIVTAAGCQTFAAITMIPLALLYWPKVNPSNIAWGAAVVLGTVNSGLAYILMFRLLKSIGIVRTVLLTYLMPVFAIALGYAVLAEPITTAMLIGGGLILLGVGLATGVVTLPDRG
jgi:drug/metabolite transporter (DMT)-like permease